MLQLYKKEYKSLFKLGLPVLVTQLGIIVVSFADTMMVGRYGVDDLASAAFVNSLFVIPTVMQIGFAQGLTPLAGALFGRHDLHETGRTLRGGLQINLLVSAAFTIIMSLIFFFIGYFGQPEELLPLISRYYLIILATLLPMAVFNSFQQVCNAVNDTALPMWMILGANALNIFGNWLLIYGNWGFPELGLAGAGISTFIARYIVMIGIMTVFFTARKYKIYREGYRDSLNLSNIRRSVWVTSYPVMIQSGVECMLWTIGAIACGWFGKIQLAAYQVVNTIAQLGFMTFISFGTATSILIANNTGVGNSAAVRRTAAAGLHLNLLLSTLASLIFFLGGRHLIYCFTDNAQVADAAVLLLLPLVIYQYMDATQITYCNAIRGTSHVKPLLWISVVSYIIVGIPVLLLFSKTFGWESIGVYYSFDVALAVASVMATFIFYRILRFSFSPERLQRTE